MTIPTINILDHNFSPNPATVSLVDSGGYVQFKNLTDKTRSVIGLGGWSALNTGNIAPNGVYTANITALSQCQYTFQANDAGKTHLQGKLILVA
jgi:hypothetical protein